MSPLQNVLSSMQKMAIVALQDHQSKTELKVLPLS
jgi:hypothetical protein